ncbi:MAG: AAA family ATPase [Phyllobacteriaceae bacterium]|nr:AAA family ATPase [Phyllobacteriaceae bacterium]
MKIAVTGKGGVGKSTIVGMLARAMADDGWKIMAIDADPDANLGSAIGVAPTRLADVVPISRMKDLARERTGAAETAGSHFILNPRVSDIPDELCVEHAGIKLLLMGTVDHAGGGCVCPEHTLVRALLRHVLTRRQECVLIDMEAGVEHFGRGTVEAVDLLVIVVEPGERSFQTARQIEKLARELGIARIALIANKVDGAADQTFVRAEAGDLDLLAMLPADPDVRASDRAGRCCYDLSEGVRARARQLAEIVVKRVLDEPGRLSCAS